jgi:hypothetical protein
LRRLLLLHFGSMMSDHATGRCTRNGVMTRNMACHAADRGTFEATLGIAEHGEQGGCNDDHPHDVFAHL